MTLTTPLTSIPRVGPAHQKLLSKLGIATVRDLLFHFPREYEDRRNITKIRNLKAGQEVCVRASVSEATKTRTFKRRMDIVHGLLRDDTGSVRAVWFRQPYLVDVLQPGQEFYFVGKVVRDQEGISLSSPAYERIREEEGSVHAARIVPVYPETARLSSKWIRFMVHSLLKTVPDLPDSLPPRILKERNLPPLSQALRSIHFPESLKEAEEARKRFAFEELFHILLFILSERKKIASVKAPSVPFAADLMQRFTGKLPFPLTDDQKKAAWRILKDLEKPRPMNRLLQGDVGSGKTVVAAMACLAAVKTGHQVAFMAPTEILVQQHFRTLADLLAPFRVRIGVLTGKTDLWISPKLPKEPIEISRKKLLEKAKDGEIDILVGTHSLIQDKVRFGKLALVVLDEQHRFGVKQRAKLLHAKGTPLIPHLLSMTATPIPRTLAMTLYGDLDLTLIKEMPKGRKPVKTQSVEDGERKKIYDFVRKEIKAGRQAFIICPRIESSEKNAELKAVTAEYKRLAEEVFPDLKLGMLHGKMAQKEKEQVMRAFKLGKLDMLVSTSVVEVGVDIPNASIMLIEGADRFGLAQLHQFRGRVGRGEHQSYCFLFVEGNGGQNRRVKSMEKTSSGFELAEQDLKIRGPGDFSGTKQWGLPDFAMQQLLNLKLVEEAREAAAAILEEDITLRKYPLLRGRVEELREKLHLE